MALLPELQLYVSIEIPNVSRPPNKNAHSTCHNYHCPGKLSQKSQIRPPGQANASSVNSHPPKNSIDKLRSPPWNGESWLILLCFFVTLRLPPAEQLPRWRGSTPAECEEILHQNSTHLNDLPERLNPPPVWNPGFYPPELIRTSRVLSISLRWPTF